MPTLRADDDLEDLESRRRNYERTHPPGITLDNFGQQVCERSGGEWEEPYAGAGRCRFVNVNSITMDRIEKEVQLVLERGKSGGLGYEHFFVPIKPVEKSFFDYPKEIIDVRESPRRKDYWVGFDHSGIATLETGPVECHEIMRGNYPCLKLEVRRPRFDELLKAERKRREEELDQPIESLEPHEVRANEWEVKRRSLNRFYWQLNRLYEELRRAEIVTDEEMDQFLAMKERATEEGK